MSQTRFQTLSLTLSAASDVIRRELAGLRWQLASQFEGLFPAVLDAAGEEVKRMPRRWIVRVSIDGRAYYRKHILHSSNWLEPISFFFRAPRSRIDWRLAGRLRALNVPVAPFLAYGERWTWRGLMETVLITEGPPGYVPLNLVTDPASSRIQQSLARFLRSLHDSGVSMRDLHTRNFLYAAETNSFCLMDLDTVAIQSKVGTPERVDHLARLHSRLPLTEEFYDAYGRDAGIDRDEVRKRAPLLRRTRCLKYNRHFQPIDCGGLKWQVRTASLNETLRSMLRDPDGFLRGRARLLKHSDNSTVGSADGFVLKRFHSRKAINAVKDLFRRSRAVRAFLKAYHLELAGISTPRAVAVSSKRVWGVFVQSYFVMEEVESGIHLRSWQGKRSRAIFEVAKLVADLHDAGFSHTDLKETNILFDRKGTPHLIDIDGVHYLGEVSEERSLNDLARLAKGALRLPGITRLDRARFLAQYCRLRKYPDWRALWKELDERITLPAPLPALDRQWVRLGGRGLGYVRADLWHAFQNAGLQTIESFLSLIGEPLSKPGLGGRYRARLRIQSEGGERCSYFKRYEREPLVARVKRWIEDGKLTTPADRDREAALALAELGIGAPRTIAWGFVSRWGLRQKSFVVSEAAPGEAIDRLMRTQPFSEAAKAFSKKHQLAGELGRTIRAFHEAGWCHRDLYLCHVFAEFGTNGLELSLIDLQRVFRPRWRIWRWRIKDLAQLNYSAEPQFVTRAMRLRFAQAYFGERKLSQFHRDILRRVERKTESIARRDRSRQP